MGPACPGVLPGPQERSGWGLLAPVFFRGPRSLADGILRFRQEAAWPALFAGSPCKLPRKGRQLVLRTWQGVWLGC